LEELEYSDDLNYLEGLDYSEVEQLCESMVIALRASGVSSATWSYDNTEFHIEFSLQELYRL